jgi:predicted transcriptional regulator
MRARRSPSEQTPSALPHEELQDVNAAIREGLADLKAGRVRPAEEVTGACVGNTQATLP